MGAGITIHYQNIIPLFDVGFWKVSSATHKTTNQNVSIWQIDYDAVQKIEKKADREKFLNNCLQSVQQMRRIHHPCVLKIIELSESIKALNFAAEPVMSCLTHEDSFTPDDASFIAYQLAQVLKFVHQNMHTILFGLSPDSIVLTSTLDLKLCDFTFASPIINEYDIGVLKTNPWTYSQFQPKLIFSSPELVNSLQTSTKTDIFSFGLTIAHAYIGQPLLASATVEDYIRCIQTRSYQFPPTIPPNVQTLIAQCLNIFPEQRPDLNHILSNELFRSLPLQALQYVEVIVTKTDEDRYNFYKGVAKTLRVFSIRILQSRFLPLFVSDVLREPRFGPVLIPQIFEIGRSLDSFTFLSEIISPLRPLFTNSSSPECLLAIITCLPIIIENIEEHQYGEIVFPILRTALSSSISSLHQEVLNNVPFMVSSMSNILLERELIPVIVDLFSTSTDIKIVSACLKCVAVCLPKLNHNVIAEAVCEKITAAWNRLTGPPEIAQAALAILNNMHPVPEINIKFVTPMVSELLASDVIDPQTQLELCNYILKSAHEYKHYLTHPKNKNDHPNQANQWLKQLNKKEKVKNEQPKPKNTGISINQFERRISMGETQNNENNDSAFDFLSNSIDRNESNPQLEPTTSNNFRKFRLNPQTDGPSEGNRSSPNLFADMNMQSSPKKSGGGASMFSGMNVSPVRK